MGYAIPAELTRAEIEIKKSRFIAYARHIETREQGMQWLEAIKAEYPDARHHCWAYLIGNPTCASNAGMGDDGEPSGTAGKPILNVLQHKGVGDVMIIVVRYFGGIKLGAGGLTRAYGQAAQAVMEILPVIEQVPTVTFVLECDFGLEQQIRHLADTLSAHIESVDYQSQVHMRVIVPEVARQSFSDSLKAHACPFKVETPA
ncbi:MAG: YigZ family protein [Hydrogenovibrio sp.]|nr:YigZ family protein [Hydrogenovibrio sp.]